MLVHLYTFTIHTKVLTYESSEKSKLIVHVLINTFWCITTNYNNYWHTHMHTYTYMYMYIHMKSVSQSHTHMYCTRIQVYMYIKLLLISVFLLLVVLTCIIRYCMTDVGLHTSTHAHMFTCTYY